MKEALDTGFPHLPVLFGVSIVATIVHLTKSGHAYRIRKAKFPWAYWLCAAGAGAETFYSGGHILLDAARAASPEHAGLAAVPAALAAASASGHGALLIFNGLILYLILAAPGVHLRTGYRPAVVEAVLRAGGASPWEIAGRLGGVFKELGYSPVNPRPWKCEAAGIVWRKGHQGVKVPVMIFAAMDSNGPEPVLRITVDVMDLILNDDKETRWTGEMAEAAMARLREPDFAPHILSMTLGRTPKAVV